jgi:hypothetical protein
LLPLGPVSLPPTIQHPALHAENAGPVNFSDRLRIADDRPSIHFIADDFSWPAMTKPSSPPDFKSGQLALFVAAAIVLLVYVWTHLH